MDFRSLVRSLALVSSLLVFSTTSSAFVIIEEGFIDPTADNHPEIDFYSFAVTAPGDVTFDVLARGFGFAGNFGASTLDAFLIVAIDDGDRTIDDILGRDDDSGVGRDSSLTLNLGIGSYLVGVSSCCIIDSEFVIGENASVDLPDPLLGDDPAYRLVIEGAVAYPPTTSEVAAPATIPLMGLGLSLLAGLNFHRKRKVRTDLTLTTH